MIRSRECLQAEARSDGQTARTMGGLPQPTSPRGDRCHTDPGPQERLKVEGLRP